MSSLTLCSHCIHCRKKMERILLKLFLCIHLVGLFLYTVNYTQQLFSTTRSILTNQKNGSCDQNVGSCHHKKGSRDQKKRSHDQKEGSCDQLWRPNEIHKLGPQFNISPVIVLGDGCIMQHVHDGMYVAFGEKLEQFRNLVKGAQKKHYPATMPNKVQMQVGQFQPIDFTRGHVVSAFLDKREKTSVIKILHLMPAAEPPLYCHTFCRGQYRIVKGKTTRFKPRTRDHEFNFHKSCLWSQFLLECHFHICTGKTVSVTSLNCLKPTNVLRVVPVGNKHKPNQLFGVCLNKIYNLKKADLPKVMNFFETFLIFGGDVVYLYGTYNVDKVVMKVLQSYVRRGILKIYDWVIPSNVTSLYTNGHYLINMDCSYRHMDKVEHLVFMDLDEVLYPLIHNNYRDLMRYLFTEKYDAAMISRFLISPDFLYKKHKDMPNMTDICCQPFSKPLGKPRKILRFNTHALFAMVKPRKVPEVPLHNITFILHFRDNYDCSEAKINETDMDRICRSTQEWLPRINMRSSLVLSKLQIPTQLTMANIIGVPPEAEKPGK